MRFKIYNNLALNRVFAVLEYNASTNIVVGGIIFPECSCIHLCMHESRPNIVS